jgi:hypothetical protein
MLVQRMIRAAKLDPNVYYELHRDGTANGQAFLVVLIVLACGLISSGTWYSPMALIFGAINIVGSWIFWVAIATAVGMRLGGRADFEPVLRATGFAYSPQVLQLFAIVPGLGLPFGLIGWLWSVVARVVAVREAMGFTTRQAVQTTLLTTVIIAVIQIVLAVLTGATLGGFGMMLSRLRP